MSQQNISIFKLPIKAASVFSAFRAIGYDGNQATVQGQKVMGSSPVAAAIGDEVTLDVIGTAILETGGVFSAGDALIVDNQGRAIKSTGEIGVAAGAVAMTSTAANGAVLTGGEMPEFVFADALEASTAAGQFVEVLLRR
jgi:hypothetical protein